jgi:hypothetical protein
MEMVIEDFENWNSATYCAKVGCGKVYITVVNQDGQILRVITHRKSVCQCDLTFFDALNRQTTFQTNRDLEVAIKDLLGNDHKQEGHFCSRYNAGVKGAFKRGELAGYSCPDAIARVLQKEIA